MVKHTNWYFKRM